MNEDSAEIQKTSENTSPYPNVKIFPSMELEDSPYSNEINQTVNIINTFWKNNGRKVLHAYEKTIGRKWPFGKQKVDVVVVGKDKTSETITNYDNPIIKIRSYKSGAPRSPSIALSSFLHELGHTFGKSSDTDFVLKQFGDRIDESKLGQLTKRLIAKEAHVELRWRKVMEKFIGQVAASERGNQRPTNIREIFKNKADQEVMAALLSYRRNSYHGHVYEFIDKLTPEEQEAIINLEARNSYLTNK